MKELNGETFLTIGEVAKHIGRGTQTIKNWYEWQDENGTEHDLPPVHTDLDAKGTRYFLESDVEQLRKFRDSISYGMLSEVSRTKWGKRGAK